MDNIGTIWLLCMIFTAVFLRDVMVAADFVLRRLARKLRKA